jgi:recyclin-1
MSLQELQQDPFDVDEFVERLAWRTGGSARCTSENFDPLALHAAFERTIKDLKEMNVSVVKQVERLEAACNEEEKAHWQRISDLHRRNQTAFGHFKALDERINFVATKVVHLGDQLEGVNTPCTRAVEAQTLMKYFSEFLEDGKPLSHLFSDPFQVQSAADIIQKLYLIAQELPSGGKFDKARDRISAKYSQIEKQLIDDFRRAYYDGDLQRMKTITAILSNFRGYSQCVDLFIEESQKGAFTKPDIFEAIPPLCKKTSDIVTEVFAAPDTVITKLVLNIYQGKLQEHIASQLSDRSDLEKYLKTMQTLYTKTVALSEHFTSYNLGNDAAFLSKVTKNIFSHYLDTYVSDETAFIRGKCSAILQKFYESKNHQKKGIQSGGIYELRRDLQAVIGTKANINLGPVVENYGGETFLSQEVAINILQEFKLAFKRCEMMSSKHDIATNAGKIFELLIHYLCIEHIDYAVELGLQAVPLGDPRSEPAIYFFDVVGRANTVFLLFEKLFSDSLVPLVSGTVKQGECALRKRDVMEAIESKLDLGLDRSLSAMVGYVKQLLTTEQKKLDFKPETEEGPLRMFSVACEKVVKYVNSQLQVIHYGLDGKNVDSVLTEFGIRFHRVVYEHILTFQYNSIGAMLLICDVNEYRKCVKDFQIPLIVQLFNTLHALCNLLVVVPENLKQVCSGEELRGMDRATLVTIIQLRSDYKTAKLANSFK